MPAATLTGSVSVGVSVTEVLPASFVMAVRIRGEQDAIHDGRATVTIRADSGSGPALPIPRDVRDEFIALQLNAREYL